MTVNHEAVSALPTGAAANKTLLRGMAVARFPYCLADDEDSRELVAVDPATGDVIPDLMFLGRVFHYDPDDSTSAHDGTACLVSSEGKRYKLANGTDVLAWAVLDVTRAAPPASPTLGDAHLVAAAATGAWAGHDGDVAIQTARGWEFVAFGIGRFLYDEATDTYYHRKATGDWVAGFGAQTLSDDTIRLGALIGADASFMLKVENQTTNAPPASPAVGNAYIIGPAPTGAWAGQAGKVAVCNVAGAFTIYTPVAGDMVYDKALGINVAYSGTQWASVAGACIAFKRVTHSGNGSMTSTGGWGYTWVNNPTGAPEAANYARTQDNTTITHAAKKVGNLLRLTYTFDGYGDWNQGTPTVGVTRDSETSVLEFRPVIDFGSSGTYTITFVITATDTNSHIYKFWFFGTSGTTGGLVSNNYIYNRRITLEEFVQ
jgi:hypothetical protein